MTNNIIKNKTFDLIFWICFGVLLLGLDILTKNLIVAHGEEILSSGGIVLIPNFLRVNYVINENVAFGLSLGNPQTNKIIFSIVAIIVSLGIVVYLWRKWKELRKLYKAAGIMIVVGAIGNVIDRLFYSAEYLNNNGASGVVDWIDFYGIWAFNFNIADCCVVIAAFILIIVMIIDTIIEYKNKSKEEKKENAEKIISTTEKEMNEMREKDKIDE